jgi:4-hydroxythreonine-4-phosphate dehydrogenase
MINSNASTPRRVCITCGDPAGVGPELVAAALPYILEQGWQPLVIMPPSLLEQSQELSGNDTPFVFAQPGQEVATDQAQVWFPRNAPLRFNPGEISREAGQVANLSLETAVELVRADPKMPLVTAPVNKQSLHLAGFTFPGQTEFLGARDGDRPIWMIMYHKNISIVLSTIHLPLMKVSHNLKPDLLLNSITALHWRSIHTLPRVVFSAGRRRRLSVRRSSGPGLPASLCRDRSLLIQLSIRAAVLWPCITIRR